MTALKQIFQYHCIANIMLRNTRLKYKDKRLVANKSKFLMAAIKTDTLKNEDAIKKGIKEGCFLSSFFPTTVQIYL